MATNAEKKIKYQVMHDKGEWINGKNVRPYETFTSVPNEELDKKVKMGFLEVVGSTKSTKRSVKKRAR
jgi:hypothetical protein